LLENDLAPALGAWLGCVDLVAGIVVQGRDEDFTLELGLTDLANDLRTVHSQVAQVSQQLLSTVLAAGELKELRSVLRALLAMFLWSEKPKRTHINEGCPDLSLNEGGMSEQGGQERDVGFHTLGSVSTNPPKEH
jgi:hypothetical protein